MYLLRVCSILQNDDNFERIHLVISTSSILMNFYTLTGKYRFLPALEYSPPSFTTLLSTPEKAIFTVLNLEFWTILAAWN